MTKVKHSTLRYAAENAYKLTLMIGKYQSMQCKMLCEVHKPTGFVTIHVPNENGEGTTPKTLKIAKAWSRFF